MIANIVFLNIGWMRRYRGLDGDSIVGGGAYVFEHGFGHEIFNFKPFQGRMYGYVQVNGRMNISRLGARPGDKSAENVLAVWVANHPAGGTFIVGWYESATVFSDAQDPPKGSFREYRGDQCGYRVTAAERDCVLLDLDKRVFEIPRGKGGLGQANVWYADHPYNHELRQNVKNYIETGRASHPQLSSSTGGRARQPDPYLRKRVEEAAITLIVKKYQSLGYEVDSVEKDNLGWDLEATLGSRTLRLEVKGLSQSGVSIELTPNEYHNMYLQKNTYRLCIVTDALSSNPRLWIFAYSPENNSWEDDDGNHLLISEVKSAHAKLSENL